MFLLLKLSRVRFVVLLCSVLAISFPVLISAGVVTLDSIKIYKTHEWLNFKPTIYFKCNGENETVLPDVKKKNVLYTFKGEESWQPLTNLTGKKCKRCGFYEHDTIKSDDVLGEWEFCASDFTTSDGKYSRFEEKEFDATFLCPDRVSLAPADAGSKRSSFSPHWIKNRMHLMLIVLITAVITLVFIVGAVIGYKYWQKRKRQQEQARFLRLFEDSDDIEDELGIGPISHTI